MKKMIAFTAPILPGKTEAWKNFTNELKEKYSKEFAESRSNLDLHERTYLQTTPNGDFVIVTLEGENPWNSFKKLTNETTPFAQWFKKQVKDIHGMDLTGELPTPELILDTETITETVA